MELLRLKYLTWAGLKWLLAGAEVRLPPRSEQRVPQAPKSRAIEAGDFLIAEYFGGALDGALFYLGRVGR